MPDTRLNRISNFIWSVADNLLRDLYVRGKYHDVIPPMTVIRRLDALLEPTRQQVLTEKSGSTKPASLTKRASCAKRLARPSTTHRSSISETSPPGYPSNS